MINHEINASITMDIDQYSLDLIEANAKFWATKQYDLDNYNCANFAIDLFNLARPNNPINIPSFTTSVYGPFVTSIITTIDKFPQMLFATLKNMKNSNLPEAGNININQNHQNKSPQTNGECN